MTTPADDVAVDPDRSAPNERPVEADPGFTEGALVVLTLVAVASLGRLLSEPAELLVPLGATALVGHGVAIGLRRSRAPGPLVIATVVIGGALAVALCLQAAIPGPGSLTDIEAELGPRVSDAWSAFERAVPPTPVLPGYVAVGAGAVWLVAWASDSVALRLGAAPEATVPAVIVVVFGTVLGDEVPATWVGIVTAAAVAGVILAERHRRGRANAFTAPGRAPGGWRAPARAGIGAVALAAIVASVAAPRLPGADGRARLDPGGVGAGPRTTVSPLVDIRSRLVNQTDRVLFRVHSEAPSYWRLTALDRFDGTVWSASDRYQEADGRLPEEPVEASSEPITQRFELRALSSIWLPAAYRPVSVDTGDEDEAVRFAQATGTLVVGRERGDAAGLTYRVRSEVPRPSRAEVSRAEVSRVGPDVGDDPGPGLTELPADLDPEIPRTAREVTALANNPYQQARRLQDWFRREFTYDVTNTSPGHSETAVTDFLAERRGYCEQFAGTYAAMARSLGLPARVAVGFTPGVADPDDPGWSVVTGRQAHAWPEVHLGEAGWVAFEPTPGRGPPGAEGYTDVEPTQDTATGPRAIAGPGGPGGGDGPGEAGPSVEGGPVTTSPPIPSAPEVTGGQGAPGSGQEPRSDPAGGADGGQVVLTVVIAVAALVTAGGVIARRRRTRRSARGSPPTGIEGAFTRAAGALAAHGFGPAGTETHLEYAARIEAEVPEVAPALGTLARMASDAAWSPTPPDPETEARAEGLAGDVARVLASETTSA